MPVVRPNDSQPRFNAWLHWFAVLVALATFALIAIGGLVTSNGAGMSVPDWPNSYGYNMFMFPPSKWVGGILYEHTHRLWASMVGLLVIALTRWLGGRAARKPLAIVGALEMLAGIGILVLRPDLKATGGFLAGIGGLVLLASLVWARNAPAQKPLPLLGWLALGLVQFQGLLGGLRVVLFKDQIGIFHAMLAQLFFVLMCAIALFTSRWWIQWRNESAKAETLSSATGGRRFNVSSTPALRGLLLFTTILIFVQLVLGATMRHQHAGLAIPDFPAAYGKLWPATDAASVERYNQQRMEVIALNPITAFQIELQMAHRLVAALILVCVATAALSARKVTGPGATAMRRLAWAWIAMIFIQIGLGAATIWSDKAADIATAHVMVGALSLATGAFLCIISMNHRRSLRHAPALSGATANVGEDGPMGLKAAAQHT